MDNDTLLKIVAHPEEYGFSWGYGPVSKGIGDKATVLMTDAPFLQFTGGNLDLARKTFGDAFILGGLDGQSPKVQSQRIVRDAVENDIALRKNRRELQLMVLRGAFGARAGRGTRVVEKPVFTGLDGKVYDTQQEAMAASMAFMIDQQQKDQ